MAPVPESGISFRDRIDLGGAFIEVIETPGHAPHHVSYRVGDILFAGEIAGVYVPLDEGFKPAPRPRRPSGTRPSGSPSRKRPLWTCRLSASATTAAGRMRRPCSNGPGGSSTSGWTRWRGTSRQGSDPFEESVLADSSPTTRTWRAGNRCRRTSRPASATSASTASGESGDTWQKKEKEGGSA